MKKFKGSKICTIGATCGSTCIAKNKDCLKERSNANIKLAVAKIRAGKSTIKNPVIEAKVRLFAMKPTNLLRRLRASGKGNIQYATQSEIMKTLGVYGSKTSIFDIKIGKAEHPYIAMNRNIKDKVVDDMANHIKVTDKPLYRKLSNMGLRALKDSSKVVVVPNPAVADRVKIAVRLYLEQNGQSFATGKPLGLNKMVLDHITPLSRGGVNEARNLVLIESNINFFKGAQETQKDFADLLTRKASTAHTEEDLKNLQKAIDSGNKTKVEEIQKQLRTKNLVARLSADKAISKEYLDGVKNKNALAKSFSGGGFAKYNTEESLNKLGNTELKQLIKVQGDELGTTTSWIKGRVGERQTGYAGGNVARAQAYLNNGGNWGFMPESWKKEFQVKYEQNVITNPRSTDELRKSFGSLENAPSWIK